MAADFSKEYPKLDNVTRIINEFLSSEYSDFFGPTPIHPFSRLKRSKVIHDSLWGTNAFSWRELAIIDTPVFQRLRNIHQTGLAYFVYPCAHHSRFEHSLGVCVMASRVFDALVGQHQTKLRAIAKEIYPKKDLAEVLVNWRAELRLAALLHDTGHSLHSHTSEAVYSKIPLLSEAARELSRFVGAAKGEGEVLSFCISRTEVLRDFLKRAQTKLIEADESDGEVDLENASLLVVGRSKYPQLQFMGDVISSDLDADKLDYLLRDAVAAGLPLRYDLERYLYTVNIVEQKLVDGEGLLEKLYATMGSAAKRLPPTADTKYPFYTTHKLQLPRQAINSIEQMIISKFMLFSYIYHHKKVRAAEGMLARLIQRRVQAWRAANWDDAALLRQFLRMTDHVLDGNIFSLPDRDIREYRGRLVNRVLPREVVGFTSNVDHPESAKLSRFMSDVLKKEKKDELVAQFEAAMGEELMKLLPDLESTAEAILARTGTWFDVPKPPTFNKLEELLIEATKITDVFPITSWIQAYISYRYHVRVFAFSEFVGQVEKAARYACQKVLDIKDPNFVDLMKKDRE
jgi:HD superfamily phosphohydrolase